MLLLEGKLSNRWSIVSKKLLLRKTKKVHEQNCFDKKERVIEILYKWRCPGWNISFLKIAVDRGFIDECSLTSWSVSFFI